MYGNSYKREALLLMNRTKLPYVIGVQNRVPGGRLAFYQISADEGIIYSTFAALKNGRVYMAMSLAFVITLSLL